MFTMGISWACKSRETPRHFGNAVHKNCSEPETVGNFQHGPEHPFPEHPVFPLASTGGILLYTDYVLRTHV